MHYYEFFWFGCVIFWPQNWRSKISNSNFDPNFRVVKVDKIYVIQDLQIHNIYFFQIFSSGATLLEIQKTALFSQCFRFCFDYLLAIFSSFWYQFWVFSLSLRRINAQNLLKIERNSKLNLRFIKQNTQSADIKVRCHSRRLRRYLQLKPLFVLGLNFISTLKRLWSQFSNVLVSVLKQYFWQFHGNVYSKIEMFFSIHSESGWMERVPLWNLFKFNSITDFINARAVNSINWVAGLRTRSIRRPKPRSSMTTVLLRYQREVPYAQ